MRETRDKATGLSLRFIREWREDAPTQPLDHVDIFTWYIVPELVGRMRSDGVMSGRERDTE